MSRDEWKELMYKLLESVLEKRDIRDQRRNINESNDVPLLKTQNM